MITAASAFWTSLALLAFTYLGYPLLLTGLARMRCKNARASSGEPAPIRVTAIVVAHNESGRIRARVENLLASDFPADRLSVLVVSDGSTDDTAKQIAMLASDRVRVIELAQRSGKPAGLNAGVAACDSEIIIFTDARQTFAADTISKLAGCFYDPQIGAASGELEIAAADSSTGAGVDAYWKLERFLRTKESEWDSCIGCTGACYAIRRTLFTPLPGDTILDDVITPMHIAAAGYRVLHIPGARAFDPQPLEPTAEAGRKRRTLAGNFQMLFRHPGWLLPWRNRLWLQLAAHKYLRLAGPALLATALISSALLSAHLIYRTALLLQIALYLLAAFGMVTRTRNPLFATPAGFVFLNAAVIRGFIHFLRGVDARWETKR